MNVGGIQFIAANKTKQKVTYSCDIIFDYIPDVRYTPFLFRFRYSVFRFCSVVSIFMIINVITEIYIIENIHNIKNPSSSFGKSNIVVI